MNKMTNLLYFFGSVVCLGIFAFIIYRYKNKTIRSQSLQKKRRYSESRELTSTKLSEQDLALVEIIHIYCDMKKKI